MAKGNFIEYVVSDNPNKYPIDGEQGGYYYELYGKPLKIVTWSGGTDEEIVAMVEAADRGEINLSDYWAVGDIRTIQLSAMSNTGVGESHSTQSATLVLMDSVCTGFTLATTTSGGKTKPDFIVGLRNSLLEKGYINSDRTNANGWSGCARRTWCNNIFRLSIPASIRGIFKQFKWKQGKGGENSSGILETTDYFGLAPEKAIFGSASYSQADEAAFYTQWDWYKTSSNRIKNIGDIGSANVWWGGSPCSDGSYDFCYVDRYGSKGYNYANNTYWLAPFGCI